MCSGEIFVFVAYHGLEQMNNTSKLYTQGRKTISLERMVKAAIR